MKEFNSINKEINNEELGVKILFDPIFANNFLKLWKVSREELREWIVALESGKYKKGRGQLCSKNEEYCCLGVKAKLEDNLVPNDHYGYGNFSFSQDKSKSSFTASLRGHKRMPPLGGLPFQVVLKNKIAYSSTFLSQINDVYESTFEQIAWILKVLYFVLFEEGYKET